MRPSGALSASRSSSLKKRFYEARAEKGDNRRIVKELEKAKKRLTTKLKERADREHKDDAITFEQMGIDRIFVDESDLYKNLGFTSKMKRIAGLPNTESNRALDMYMKTRYLAERKGGIVFATGTPISNTMAEMYTLQRYLAPETLSGRGRGAFRRLGREFRRARHGARTCAGRLGLPHAHAVREIRQPAGTALDVPLLRGRADGGHAAPAPSGNRRRQAAYHRRSGIPGIEGICRDAGEPRAEAPHDRRSIPRSTTCSRSPATAGRPRSICAWSIPSPRPGDTKVSRAIEKIYRYMGRQERTGD